MTDEDPTRAGAPDDLLDELDDLDDLDDLTVGQDVDDTGDWDEEEPGPGQLDLAQRHSMRRVPGLSTELEDVSEVEYRQLRLERVVLVSVWTSGTQALSLIHISEPTRPY